MPKKLQLYELYVYYVVHICDFVMLRVKDGEITDLLSDGVLDPDQRDAGEFLDHGVLGVPPGRGLVPRDVPVGHAQGAQPLHGPLLNHLLHHLLLGRRGEGLRLSPLVQDVLAPVGVRSG